MSKFVRVYHPTLNSWEDVPAGSVESWKSVGWATKRPAHIDDSDALPPAPTFLASIPRDARPAEPEAGPEKK